jgi:predicted PurR-regulated permease PerM
MAPERSQPILIIFLLLVLLTLSFFILQPYLTAIILASVVAIGFWPVYKYILKYIPFKWLASLLMVLIVLVVFLLPLSFFGMQAFREAFSAYSSLSGSGGIQVDSMINWLQQRVSDVVPVTFGSISVNQYLKSILEWFINNLGSIFSSIVGGIFTIVLSLFILFFFFKDGSKMKMFAIEHSPLHEPYNTRLIEKIKLSINSVIRGSLVTAILQGVVSGIGFYIFGVPNPALWGGLATIAAFVPTLGTSLVLIPTIIYLFFVGSPLMGIGLIIWGVLSVGLIDDILGPKLIGKGMQMHPLLIMLAVIGGVGLFGPLGIILGPMIFALLYAVSDIYFELIKKDSQSSET